MAEAAAASSPGQVLCSLNGVGGQVEKANPEVRFDPRGAPDVSPQRNQDVSRTE